MRVNYRREKKKKKNVVKLRDVFETGKNEQNVFYFFLVHSRVRTRFLEKKRKK